MTDKFVDLPVDHCRLGRSARTRIDIGFDRYAWHADDSLCLGPNCRDARVLVVDRRKLPHEGYAFGKRLEARRKVDKGSPEFEGIDILEELQSI